MEKTNIGVKRVVLLIVVLSLFAGFFGSVSANPSSKGFEVDNVLLKLMVKQGESFSKIIKITNTDSMQKDFKLTGDTKFFSISEQEFSLEPGESKSLDINFEPENQPGVYVGSILFLSSKEEFKMPVILEVETKEVLFDSSINIPLEYGGVYPGGSLAVENKIFNLENIGIKTIDVSYIVKDFEGRTIFSEGENIAVENQILTTKLISIPEIVKTGDYVVFVIVKYQSSVGTSSYFFKIIENKEGLESIKFFDSWIFVIVLFAVVIFFIIFTKQRDNLFLELQKQHKTEIKEEIERFNKEGKKISRLRAEKRKRELKKLMEKKKKRLRVIGRIYKERVKTFKKLKKQKKKSEMEEKLAQWKKQGYNVGEFLIKTGKNNQKKNIGEEIKGYKKQGYKF
jgi:hypothetical protein